MQNPQRNSQELLFQREKLQSATCMQNPQHNSEVTFSEGIIAIHTVWKEGQGELNRLPIYGLIGGLFDKMSITFCLVGNILQNSLY